MLSGRVFRHLFVAALSAVVPVAEVAAQTIPDLPTVRYTLDNGLDVVLAPDSSVAEASVELWVRVGTRDEPPGKFGLTHFWEHATPFGMGMGRTTAGRRLLDSLRTGSNARTRLDYTLYYQQTRAEGLDLFLRVFADRLAADPTAEHTPAQAEWHRANVIAEMARQAPGRYGWPSRYAERAGTFGVAHPYGHAGYGSDEETAAITADDLLRWSRAHFRPEYSTLIVVGQMDTTAVRGAIARFFGRIPGGTRPPLTPWAPTIRTAVADTVSVPADQHRILVNWPGPAWGTADDGHLMVLKHILSARVAASKPGWLAEVGANYERAQLAGRLQVYAAMASADDLRRAERLLRSLVAELAQDGPREEELSAARTAIRQELMSKLSRLGWDASRSELLGESMLFAGDPDAWRRHANRAIAATREQVREAAGRWFTTPGFALTTLGTEVSK
jgi:predicted Zn-dependent peptidase